MRKQIFPLRSPLQACLMLGLAALFLVSCAAAQSGSPGTPEAATDIPASTPTPDPQIQALLKNGPHGAGYDLGKGPNTYCSRCHSPLNWDPAAKVDPPPNCVSCKFPFEPEVRQAASNPLIPEEAWSGIGCHTCHEVEAGVVNPEIAWTNPQTGYSEMLSSSSALCEKCHQDTETLRHSRALQGEVHAGYTCTGCHEPHSVQASCSSKDCHPEVEAARQGSQTPPHAGHDPDHQTVRCGACHDASGAMVSLDQASGLWQTLRTVEVLGRDSTGAFQSHNLQKAIDCARCHFEGNPWELQAPVEEHQGL